MPLSVKNIRPPIPTRLNHFLNFEFLSVSGCSGVIFKTFFKYNYNPGSKKRFAGLMILLF